MKNIILILALVVSVTVGAQAQTSYVLGRTSVTRITTDTLGPTVTAYAATQRVCGDSTYRTMLSTPIPRRSDASLSGWITWVKLRMDSTSAGDFIVMAFRDTTGAWAAFTAARTVYQKRQGLEKYKIGEVMVSTSASGTTAAGSDMTSGATQCFLRYNMDDLSQTKIYWVIVANGAWTQKKNGVIRLETDLESD